MEARVTLRPITEKDREFLCRLYVSTREDEMALVPWSDAEKQAFLVMQFNAQTKFYHEQFKQAEFQAILLDGEPIGRLYIDRRADEIRLIDIALLPEHRRKGIGSRLLKGTLAEAERAGLPVRIHVESYNPALHLYYRLGFRKIGDHGVYYLMEWSPRQPAKP
jgi:ribosomal protein S18 acetylase RimI-like enzyme